jgi:hypothetical protein
MRSKEYVRQRKKWMAAFDRSWKSARIPSKFKREARHLCACSALAQSNTDSMRMEDFDSVLKPSIDWMRDLYYSRGAK